MKNDAVSKAIIRLFDTEMFYAELITQMRRVIDTTLPSVAGVCIKNQIELHINPTGRKLDDGRVLPGFNDLSIEERVAVLRHECEHILRGHIPRAKELAPEVYENKEDLAENVINSMKHQGLNIAMDCAINGHIKGLPDWAVFPKNFDLKDGETFEWYMEQLKNNEKAKSFMSFDDHSLWRESDKQDKETLKEKIRQAVNKAAQKARAAGKMTSDNELLVSELNKVSVNWKEQLRRFIARTSEFHFEPTKKKRNRRYGIMYPGQMKVEDLHIGVITDSSGSVSDQAYTQFMAEIGNIAKYAKVTVVDADCEVKDAYVWKKGKPKYRKGCGGTAYQPGFDYFNKIKDIDAVIYFGDMDSSDTPKKPKYPVLWSIVGSQEPPAKFGAKIFIKVSGE